MKIHPLSAALVFAGAAALAGCGDGQDVEQMREQAEKTAARAQTRAEQALARTEERVREAVARYKRLPEDVPQRAVAVLHPTAGNDVTGTVTFVPDEEGLRVATRAEGLSPGKHGYHIHIYGDCTAADGTSAGTHFHLEGSSLNPPENIGYITGDLGNLEAGEDGEAAHETVLENGELTGPKSIIGRAVIVHAEANDPEQPPIGAAGARQACGVIGIANPG